MDANKKEGDLEEIREGDVVTLTDGPFAWFDATVLSIDRANETAIVRAHVFGNPDAPLEVKLSTLERQT